MENNIKNLFEQQKTDMENNSQNNAQLEQLVFAMMPTTAKVGSVISKLINDNIENIKKIKSSEMNPEEKINYLNAVYTNVIMELENITDNTFGIDATIWNRTLALQLLMILIGMIYKSDQIEKAMEEFLKNNEKYSSEDLIKVILSQVINLQNE